MKNGMIGAALGLAIPARAASQRYSRYAFGRDASTSGFNGRNTFQHHLSARRWSDLVCLMRAGRVAKMGTPKQPYEGPADAFIAHARKSCLAAYQARRSDLLWRRSLSLLAGRFRLPFAGLLLAACGSLCRSKAGLRWPRPTPGGLTLRLPILAEPRPLAGR